MSFHPERKREREREREGTNEMFCIFIYIYRPANPGAFVKRRFSKSPATLVRSFVVRLLFWLSSSSSSSFTKYLGIKKKTNESQPSNDQSSVKQIQSELCSHGKGCTALTYEKRGEERNN